VHSFVDFHVDVACNTNAYDVCKIKFTFLLYLLTYFSFKSANLSVAVFNNSAAPGDPYGTSVSNFNTWSNARLYY